MTTKRTHLFTLSFSPVLAAFFCLFLSLAVLFPPAANAQHNYMPSDAFQHGEKITYHVFYNVIGMYVNAGTAVLTTRKEKYNNKNAYHVVAEGVTNKKYDWIFKVRDRYESYFEADDLKPIKFTRDVSEGDIKFKEEVVFNNKNNTAVCDNKCYKVPPSVMDVINAMFYARNINYDAYKEDDKISFSMFLDNQVYNMYIRYLGKEEVKTRYGTFKAIKLRPLLLKGTMFEGGEKMTLWVTDDANHIPIRVESKIAVGSIKVDMMEYSNVKHPLSSLVAVR